MQSTAIQKPEQATLAELAVQINDEHHQAKEAMNDGLQHALEAGRLLLQAKKRCNHGDWLQWIKTNFEGSERTAQAYMRVAQHYPKLNGKAQRVADLTFRGALSAVASNSITIARRTPTEQRTAINAWEKNPRCKNAHQAVIQADRIRAGQRSAAASDPAVMQVLDGIPTNKRRAVVEWAEEQADGAVLTNAMIQSAWKDVMRAEPDDEDDCGDQAEPDDSDKEQPTIKGARLCSATVEPAANNTDDDRLSGLREFLDKTIPSYRKLCLLSDTDIATALYGVGDEWSNSHGTKPNDLEPLVRAWMSRTNKSASVAAIILEGIAAKLRAEQEGDGNG